MKTTIKFISISLIALSLTMCHTKQKSDPNNTINPTENFDWLLGNWKRTNDKIGNVTYENWEKISEIHYSGIGYTLQNGDTISLEFMKLTKLENSWDFIVKTRKDSLSTVFDVKALNDSSFTCTNDINEFPNVIYYSKDGANLKAKIKGGDLEIAFDFEKIKN